VTRAFVAVVPPDAVLDAIAAATTSLDFDFGGARRTTREQWHVTLQFLGNAADVDGVAAVLEPLAVRAGEVRIGGAGAFPTARRGRVLWLGVAEGAELFHDLAAHVGHLLAPLGFTPEARAFHPHLTLARVRRAAIDLRSTVATLDSLQYGDPWTVSEVVLVESRLHSAGARYVPRASIRLRP
jgi:2'-5' RNA ligase